MMVRRGETRSFLALECGLSHVDVANPVAVCCATTLIALVPSNSRNMRKPVCAHKRHDPDATPTLCFIMVYYMFNATSKLPGANAQKHILASARAHKLAYVCRNSPADSLGESCITALPQQLPYCYCYCYCYYCYCYCYCYCYYSCYCSYYYYDYKYYYDD